MKIFHLCIIITFGIGLTSIAAMGSKCKPATEVKEPKVLPESTAASAISSTVVVPAVATNTPVKLIENTTEDNQKVHKELPAEGDSSKKTDGSGDSSKKAQKTPKKKTEKAKKTSGKPAKAKKKSS